MEHSEVTHTSAKMDSAGRISIPAALRKKYGFKPGQEVLMASTPEGIRMYTRRDALEKARAYVASLVPEGVSLVDELLAERRAEAAEEDTEFSESSDSA